MYIHVVSIFMAGFYQLTKAETIQTYKEIVAVRISDGTKVGFNNSHFGLVGNYSPLLSVCWLAGFIPSLYWIFIHSCCI